MRNDELRQRCVTASEMPALVGLCPYGRTPMTIWMQKMGLVEPAPETPELRWGRLIEQALMQAYKEDTGLSLAYSDTYQHADYPFLAGTPDALVIDRRRGVEFKTVGFRHGADWLDGPPSYVQVQCAIYMSIFDVPQWDVGRLILATRDWKIETVERDLVLEEMLIDAARHFYEQHIVQKIPPTLDGSDAASRYLQHKYPTHTGEILNAELYPWILPAVRDYFVNRRAKAAHERAMKTAAAQIKDCIGERAGMQGDGWLVTWKADKNGTRSFRATSEEDFDAGE